MNGFVVVDKYDSEYKSRVW